MSVQHSGFMRIPEENIIGTYKSVQYILRTIQPSSCSIFITKIPIQDSGLVSSKFLYRQYMSFFVYSVIACSANVCMGYSFSRVTWKGDMEMCSTSEEVCEMVFKS